METTTEKAHLVAMVSGVIGAVLLALTLTPGDGEYRVAVIVRTAIVFLASGVAALGLLVCKPRASAISILVAVGNVVALAVVFGVGRTPSKNFDVPPVEALGGLPAIAAGGIQVVGFIVAALSHWRRKEVVRS